MTASGGDPAELAYEAIRTTVTDVAQIAENVRCKPATIERIKRHLFFQRHLLDRYVALGVPAEYRRFDPDLEIAAAWRRLAAGAFDAQDMQLLRHEAAEVWYMRRHGSGYAAAHQAAERRFPAPRYGGPRRR